MKIETVKVKSWGKGQGEFVEINKSDFDPAKHELFNAPAPKPIAAAQIEDDLKVTDEAAQLAAEAGIDLALIEGTGKNGKILLKDVEKAVDALTTPKAE